MSSACRRVLTLLVLLVISAGCSREDRSVPDTGPLDLGESVVAFDAGPRESHNHDIYAMDLISGQAQRLTAHAAHDAFPDWSPDGSQIAFTSERDGNPEIYVIDVDGSAPRRLTRTLLAGELYADWSPDGELIAFSAWRLGRGQLYVMDAYGSNRRRLATATHDGSFPDWSPDGTQIAFVAHSDSGDCDKDIYVIDVQASTGSRAKAKAQRLTETCEDEVEPLWSPDGSRIAFISGRDGNYELYVMNADGSEPKRMTTSHATEHAPSWSPDGAEIAFCSERDGNWELYVVTVDGGELRRLTVSPDADDLSPAWRR